MSPFCIINLSTGLVVGALIRYTTKASEKVKVNFNFTTNEQTIPNIVILHIPINGTGSSYDYFEYDYARERTDKTAEENELEEMVSHAVRCIKQVSL